MSFPSEDRARLRFVAVVATVALVLVACGDDSGGAGGAGDGAGGGASHGTGGGGSTDATGTTASSSSSSSSGLPADGCAALCEVVNASLQSNGCAPDDCGDVCARYDRPGCEPEGNAAAGCRSTLDVSCACDEGVTLCTFQGGDCVDEEETYDACEGTCVQAGGGTREEAEAAYDAFCVAQTGLVDAVCTDEEFDCEVYRSIYLDGAEGCEAELTVALECAAAAIAAADPEGCVCNGGAPTCADLGEGTCAAEFDAVELCTSCD